MLEDAGVPSELYNWEPRRGAENSMWDKLIPPLFIRLPVRRCFLISARVYVKHWINTPLRVGRWVVVRQGCGGGGGIGIKEKEVISILDL